MSWFLSCDWGSSNLRISLADTLTGHISAAASSGEGIAFINNDWQSSRLPATEKTDFYFSRLKPHIDALTEKAGVACADLKLVISGMASSSIGFADVSYSQLPLPLDGSCIQTARLSGNESFEHDVLVIGGVRTANDVIRGEETQLLGCMDEPGQPYTHYFIIPGTHSKHIHVKDGNWVDFKTFMTGELFGLLANQSILKDSVEALPQGQIAMGEFKRGLDESRGGNVLNTIFHTRTNQLFGLNTKHENFGYLSGLMIGAELSELPVDEVKTVTLVAGENLSTYYHVALGHLFPESLFRVLSSQQAAEAVVRGQLKIARYLKFL